MEFITVSATGKVNPDILEQLTRSFHNLLDAEKYYSELVNSDALRLEPILLQIKKEGTVLKCHDFSSVS